MKKHKVITLEKAFDLMVSKTLVKVEDNTDGPENRFTGEAYITGVFVGGTLHISLPLIIGGYCSTFYVDLKDVRELK